MVSWVFWNFKLPSEHFNEDLEVLKRVAKLTNMFSHIHTVGLACAVCFGPSDWSHLPILNASAVLLPLSLLALPYLYLSFLTG